MTKGIWAMTILAVLITTSILGLSIIPVDAAVGDIISVIDLSGFIDEFCSIGVAFDGTDLYVDQCSDGRIWKIDTTGVILDVRDFSAEIPENPNAMAFDAKRGGLWVGAQGCQINAGVREMPIYFVDFQGTPLTFADDTVTLEFTIPETLINPATTDDFLGFCFTDGLAYNENDPTTSADDEIWFSDDVNQDVGVFRPNGAFVTGFDAVTIDASLNEFPAGTGNSGLAIGGSNLYLGNDGGGDVFRATIPAFTLVDQFVSADERQEDMECDPVTFAPTEVMWVRTTPQGGAFPNVLTAFEIEPDTCGLGGEDPIPEADPRTMGFWKNHEDETTEHLPMTIGDLEVTDFETAQLVMKVSAKNAHDMLAAQLLAAELNVWNNVLSCTEVDDAITEAQAILSGEGYTEPGSTDAPKKGDKAVVNAIKDILDNFNNNGCT